MIKQNLFHIHGEITEIQLTLKSSVRELFLFLWGFETTSHMIQNPVIIYNCDFSAVMWISLSTVISESSYLEKAQTQIHNIISILLHLLFLGWLSHTLCALQLCALPSQKPCSWVGNHFGWKKMEVFFISPLFHDDNEAKSHWWENRGLEKIEERGYGGKGLDW